MTKLKSNQLHYYLKKKMLSSKILQKIGFLFIAVVGIMTITGKRRTTHPKYWVTPKNIRLEHITIDLIPKIFHRTWVNESIPAEWVSSFKDCTHQYREWQTMFWTDKRAHDFISQYYPSFLIRFDSYKYPIQRADAIRYFVLYHYGGVYMDLDVGCSSSSNFTLEDILKFPAIIPKTKPIGYSNDFMAAQPRHSFFKNLVMNLEDWDHSYFFPYLTVFFSTGPMFLNFQFWWWRGKGADFVWVLDPDLYSEDGPWRMFTHLQGSTWHDWDASIIKLCYRIFIQTSFINLVILVGMIGYFLRKRVAFLMPQNNIGKIL